VPLDPPQPRTARGSGQARSLWQRALALGLGAMGASGCRGALGVDDYHVAPADQGAGGVDAATASLPLLPAIPDESRVAACQSCVAEQCADLRTTCLGSPRCRAMLACQGQCRDPACLVACTDAWPRSYDFEAYFACAYDSWGVIHKPSACLDACGAGRNWDCTGHYSWPVRDQSLTLSIAVHVTAVGLAAQGPLTYPIGADIAP
jgi:hypothetical protein